MLNHQRLQESRALHSH